MSFFSRITHLLPLLLFILAACGHERPQCIDTWTTTGVDEAEFTAEHHYWKNFNFVTTDSLCLQSCIPGEVASIYVRDSAVLVEGDEIVVANVAFVPSDSIDSVWIMVAKDQITMGWVHEGELLNTVVPDNPVSRFIAWFSDSRTLVVLAFLALAFVFILIRRFRRQRIYIVHFHDIRSFYPTLLCLTTSASASLYGTLQHCSPEAWREFYFHPTLNPFGQPPLLMTFLFSVWAILIVAIAVVDDLRKQPHLADAASYLTMLGGVCIVLYLVFSLTVHHLFGYVLLFVYWIFALWRHWVGNHAAYRCGRCGSAMREPGRCPHCGTLNEK